MVLIANPAAPVLTDADWSRLSSLTQKYAAASYELIGKARDYRDQGDLRQASEKGWGAAAQLVKAVAENWREYGVTHGRHQDLRALVAGLTTANRESDLFLTFQAAQDLHENFYENNVSDFVVGLSLEQTAHFIDLMTPQLRRPRPPRGFQQIE